jgi:pimeloyl-ACP methyl ester carboxylesterase
MTELKINGRSFYYELHGEEGETVVLLHHGFGSLTMWKNIWPELVKNGYRVLMYDRRGYGRSEGGDDFLDFHLSDRFRAESVDELGQLAVRLGLEAFHLVGQCEGGVIALQFAARYPRRVMSVTAASTLCFTDSTMIEFNRVKFPKSFNEMPEDVRAKMVEWHGPDRAEAYFEQFRTAGGAYGSGVYDLRGVLGMVSKPALVIYPDRSVLFEVEQGVHMYRCLPQGELVVLPYCGHNSYEYQPGEYVHFLVKFLKRHGSDGGREIDLTRVCYQ